MYLVPWAVFYFGFLEYSMKEPSSLGVTFSGRNQTFGPLDQRVVREFFVDGPPFFAFVRRGSEKLVPRVALSVLV